MRVIVFCSKDGWRWHAKAENGEIVSESGEAYRNKSFAIKMAKKLNPNARAGDRRLSCRLGLADIEGVSTACATRTIESDAASSDTSEEGEEPMPLDMPSEPGNEHPHESPASQGSQSQSDFSGGAGVRTTDRSLVPDHLNQKRKWTLEELAKLPAPRKWKDAGR
jgi:uncharacterized protein YegP (UPF0339 family)